MGTSSKWGNIELIMCKKMFNRNEMSSGVEKLLVIHLCNSISVRTGLSSKACGQQHHVVPRVVKAMKHERSAGSSEEGVCVGTS